MKSDVEKNAINVSLQGKKKSYTQLFIVIIFHKSATDTELVKAETSAGNMSISDFIVLLLCISVNKCNSIKVINTDFGVAKKHFWE